MRNLRTLVPLLCPSQLFVCRPPPQGHLTFCPSSPPPKTDPHWAQPPPEGPAANRHHLPDSQTPGSVGFSILPPASAPFCFISNTCLLCSQLFPSRTTGGACLPGAGGLEKRLVTPREVWAGEGGESVAREGKGREGALGPIPSCGGTLICLGSGLGGLEPGLLSPLGGPKQTGVFRHPLAGCGADGGGAVSSLPAQITSTPGAGTDWAWENLCQGFAS